MLPAVNLLLYGFCSNLSRTEGWFFCLINLKRENKAASECEQLFIAATREKTRGSDFRCI